MGDHVVAGTRFRRRALTAQGPARGLAAGFVGVGADETHVHMVAVFGPMAHEAERVSPAAGVLKPLTQLASCRTAPAGLFIERPLQLVVHEDGFDAVVFEPVLEENPLTSDIEVVWVDATKPTGSPSAAALVVGDVHITPRLVGAMTLHAPAAAVGDVVYTHPWRAWMPRAHRVKGILDPKHGLQRSPGAVAISAHVARVRRQAFGVAEAAVVGCSNRLAGALWNVRVQVEDRASSKTVTTYSAVPAKDLIDGHAMSCGNAREVVAAANDILDPWYGGRVHAQLLSRLNAVRVEPGVEAHDRSDSGSVAVGEVAERIARLDRDSRTVRNGSWCTRLRFGRRGLFRAFFRILRTVCIRGLFGTHDELLADQDTIFVSDLIPIAELFDAHIKALRDDAQGVSGANAPDASVRLGRVREDRRREKTQDCEQDSHRLPPCPQTPNRPNFWPRGRDHPAI